MPKTPLPKEDRELSAKMADYEFLNQIYSRGGPLLGESLQEYNASLIPTKDNWNLQGLMIPKDMGPQGYERMNSTELYNSLERQEPAFDTDSLVPGTVYSVGAEAADEELWSHEFRHVPLDAWSKPSGLPSEEAWNRLWDVYHALGSDDEQFEVVGFANYMNQVHDENFESEQDVLEFLDKYVPEMAKMEAHMQAKYAGLEEPLLRAPSDWVKQYEQERLDAYEARKNISAYKRKQAKKQE